MMASVLVWQSQLTANDFPPVCAMTGAPAETWKKFTFSKTPGWAFWVGGLILSAVLAERVTGHLPLTRASAKKIDMLRWAIGGVIALGVALCLVAFFLTPGPNGGVVVVLFISGIFVISVGVLGAAAGRNVVGPTAALLDVPPGQNQRLIEIRRVHPRFVSAVQQLQHMRAMQAYQAQSPIPEQSK
jgi:hypothetical protein